MKTAILILAAGASSRMGSIKQLLPYEQTFILGKVIENSLDTGIEDVYVVLGANSEIINRQLKKYPVTCIQNENYASGLSSSISCGVRTLSDYDAILICLADQPKIDAVYFESMISMFRKHKKYIITSDYQGINGVPAIFPDTIFPQLLKLTGDKGAKQLLNSKLNYTKTLFSSEKLSDIDTPEDYYKLTTKK